MRTHHFHSQQKLPVSIDRAWAFFCDPKNLSAITPPYMRFTIVSGADIPMFPGQRIEYVVTPLFGIRMKWVTEITSVIPKSYFVDEQHKGPYALWRHEHSFTEIVGGIEMTDNLQYKMPYGFLGSLFHPLIQSRIEEIFEFRRKKLIEIFGEFKPGV